MQCCWLGLCCQGVCTPGKWGHVGWVAVAPRDPSPAGWEAFGCQHLLCSWVGVVVLVRTNQSGKWAVAGMWEILHVAFSTRSQALQANPSLSMPIGMASPRGCWGAGPRSCPPALAAGKPSPGCSGEQCCVSPCPSLWAGLALSAHHSSPARHALSPQPPSFLLGCAVLPAQCHCPMSFPTEHGRGCSNGGVGEVCAGCLHTPGIRRDLSTHP